MRRLPAHHFGILGTEEQRRLLDLVPVRAATVLGISGHGIAVGTIANLCVHPGEQIVDVLREHARPGLV